MTRTSSLWSKKSKKHLKKYSTFLVIRERQIKMTLKFHLTPLRMDIVLLPEDPALSLLGIYPEDAPTCNKDTCSTMFITALCMINRSWKEPRCPSTEECLQKMWYIYTTEYYAAIKKNEFMKFLAKWVDLEGIILSEVTHSQRNSHNMYSLIIGY